MKSAMEEAIGSIRSASNVRRRTAAALRKLTGETLTERKHSFWMWVQNPGIEFTHAQEAFRSYFLKEAFEEEPKESDPPLVRTEADLNLLLAERGLPRNVFIGGRLVKKDFKKEGWGFLRPTDDGWQDAMHRYRMRKVMRRRRELERREKGAHTKKSSPP